MIYWLFSKEVVDEARTLSAIFGDSPGAYTDPQDPEEIREEICKYIKRRDGDNINVSVNDIFCSLGATKHLLNTLGLLITAPTDAVMILCQEYPMYDSCISLAGGKTVNYYPRMEHGWDISVEELILRYDEAVKSGLNIKALVIVNPGNQLGNLLTKTDQKEIIHFGLDRDLVLIVDEVYQNNIW